MGPETVGVHFDVDRSGGGQQSGIDDPGDCLHGGIDLALGRREAGIVGRVSHTIITTDFADTQEGTLHFDYLVRDGFVKVARDLAAHCQQRRALSVEPALSAGVRNKLRGLRDADHFDVLRHRDSHVF